jgi:hypothetical protein
VTLDIDRRPDYMHKRGQSANLTIGPFGFGIDTSDEGFIGFEVRIFRWVIAWSAWGREGT